MSEMSDDQEVERLINVKGLNGPRVTPALIDEQIVSEACYIFPETTCTVCCLTLQNGFQVVGHPACADPSNFDAELGRHIACRNAREQIWALEGYLLKTHLHAVGAVPEGVSE